MKKLQILSAKSFTDRLMALQSDTELIKIKRYFKSETSGNGAEDKFMGVKMGDLFALAKEFEDMPITEIENFWKVTFMNCARGPLALWIKLPALRKLLLHA